jgi:hypothetical protein
VTLSLVTMESSLDRRSKSRKPRAERKRSRGRVSSTEPELFGAEGLTSCFLPDGGRPLGLHSFAFSRHFGGAQGLGQSFGFLPFRRLTTAPVAAGRLSQLRGKSREDHDIEALQMGVVRVESSLRIAQGFTSTRALSLSPRATADLRR